MYRARPLILILVLLAAAATLTGCGGAEGPAGPGVAGSVQTASQDVQAENSFFDRLFGNYSPPSSVTHDTSITDSIAAGYGDVPGASMLDDADLTDLGYDDDPWSSLSSRTLDLGDSSLSMTALGDDPFDSLDRPSWDAAATAATDMYGGIGGALDDLSLDDPMLDDPMLDDPMLDDPMLDDPMLDGPSMASFDEPALDMSFDDPMLDTSFDDSTLDTSFEDPMLDTSFEDPMLDAGW